jgi:hypothetical protein
MDSSHKFFVTFVLGFALSACASDPMPPDYRRIGMPDDAAASVLGEYLLFLPSEWERGTITISPCEEADIDVDCDFYVEHHTRQCDFGAYMLYFSGDAYNRPHYKTIPDERAKDCFR